MLAINKVFDFAIDEDNFLSFNCVVIPNFLVSMNDEVESGWLDVFSEVKTLVLLSGGWVGNFVLVVACEVIVDEDWIGDVEGDMNEVFKVWLEADDCTMAELVDNRRTGAGKGSEMKYLVIKSL